MVALTAARTPFALGALLKALFEPKHVAIQQSRPQPHETALFHYAQAALAAKLAVVDGPLVKAELHAFEALFVEVESQAGKLRSCFMKQVGDRSSALQFARQIASMTGDDLELRTRLLSRLFSVATADSALNAAEMEFLRAVADAFGLTRETFRQLAANHQVPSASPYEVLGVATSISDEQLRARYMAKVQMLHPDRYHAAGASAETVAMLSDQLAAVNAAYQQVRASRARAKKAPLFGRKTTKGVKAA